MEKLDSDESAFIAKAGNPEIGYLKQIAFDDPDVTLEQEVRKCFVKMDERKAELARAAAELEHDYSDEKVASIQRWRRPSRMMAATIMRRNMRS